MFKNLSLFCVIFLVWTMTFQAYGLRQNEQTFCSLLQPYQDLTVEPDEVRQLGRAGADASEACGPFQHTPLHLLATTNYHPNKLDVLEAFIEIGADPRLRNTHRQRPVEMADWKLEQERVKWVEAQLHFGRVLRAYEADRESLDVFLRYEQAQADLFKSQTHYDQAADFENKLLDVMETLPVISEDQDICEPLMFFEIKITPFEIQAFVRNESNDIDRRCDLAQNTPIHLAAGSFDNGDGSKIDVVNAILAGRPDLSLRNIDGQKAVDVAEEFLSNRLRELETDRKALTEIQAKLLVPDADANSSEDQQTLERRQRNYNSTWQQYNLARAVRDRLVEETNR